MPPTATHVGETLRRVRRDHRFSLRHVAERAGISVATLSRVETNKQNVDVTLLLVLAKVLDVSVSTILGDGDGHDGELDHAMVVRHLRKLETADRTKLLLQSAHHDSQPLLETVDNLLATIDLLRAELVRMQRKVNRRGGRRG